MSSQDYYGQQQPHYGSGYPNHPPQAHPPQGGYYPPQQPGYGPPQQPGYGPPPQVVPLLLPAIHSQKK
ncbi:uncharacterized protein BHQ10_009867 [Talaromyces amestolkiae]|uniref:Uncharacterized protein n=1 Tax=Talaromyces amestolkiae TaxID=1196081 RepID=A0A364LDF8_TALAM|nr:uncharacterized protein BHQ10_009867 [Talaromyces amestolkiae]RAO73855.1 hypothetical protein BHQ10_009867 [Talaromyces amestolkiae]